MKSKKKQTTRIILTAALLVYAAVLVYALFFSEHLGRGVPSEDAARINLVPFREIRRFLLHWDKVGMKYSLINTAGNILAFLPLGFLSPLLFLRLRRWFRMAGIGLLVSLVIEILQLVSGAGVFDVDDLILNTVGTILGYAVFALLRKVLQNRGFGS